MNSNEELEVTKESNPVDSTRSNEAIRSYYVSVSEDVTSTESEEFELESDSTLLLSTLKVQYPNATGLKFRNPLSGAFRTLKALDGHIHPPQDSQGWNDRVFYVVYPKCATEPEPTRKRSNSDTETAPPASGKRFLSEDNQIMDVILLGLNYTTTDDEAQEYFSRFGPLDMLEIKKDQFGKSRGFGFIRFKDVEAQKECLKRRHNLSGRWVEAKRPSARQSGPQESNRLFVTRLSQNITPQDLQDYFAQFGEVIDSYMPKNYRGFGFVTFDNADSASLVLEKGERHLIKGERAVVSRAEPRHAGNSSREPFQSRDFDPHSRPGQRPFLGEPSRSTNREINEMVNMVMQYQRYQQHSTPMNTFGNGIEPSSMMYNQAPPPNNASPQPLLIMPPKNMNDGRYVHPAQSSLGNQYNPFDGRQPSYPPRRF